MSDTTLSAVIDCFLSQGCKGKITVPLEIRVEKGKTAVDFKHSEYYEHACSSCRKHAPTEKLQKMLFGENPLVDISKIIGSLTGPKAGDICLGSGVLNVPIHAE